MTLAFSGGGTRAAALSYGVLKELRDTIVPIDGRSVRLLDEVDTITSVSGGSFTAAYDGLNGDKIFTDFERVFLRRDINQSLIDIVLNPLGWFSGTGRTERAIQFYDEHIFNHATFADMAKPNRPFIFINASDLGYGVRFSFIQEYFNLLCSDLSTYPVARAVAASSAVPVLFNPVVVENYAGCDIGADAWLQAAKKRAAEYSQAMQIVDGLETLIDKDVRKYVHFVDGGVTDNLGLRALIDLIAAAGGVDAYTAKLKRAPTQRMVLIVVNASTYVEPTMDNSNVQPSMLETVSAISDIQLHRYNDATLDLMKLSLAEWAKAASASQKPISSHFIEVSLRDVAEPNQRRFFQTVPTTSAQAGPAITARVRSQRARRVLPIPLSRARRVRLDIIAARLTSRSDLPLQRSTSK